DLAYAFGKKSPGEKEAAEDKKLPVGAGKKGGEGKAESKALKQAKYELDVLKVSSDAAKRIYEGRLADEEYYFNQSLKDLDSYVETRREAENQQFSALRAALEAEKKVLEISRISRQERNVRTAQLNEQLAALQQRHQETLTKIDRDAQQHRLAAERQAWQDKIALLQEVTAGFQAQYQRMADAGVITFTEGQAKIAAQQAKVLAAQQQAIETQLGQIAPDTEAARQLQAQLNLIKQKTDNFNQQSAAAAEDANRRDYDRNASHASRILSINEQIEDMQRSSQQARLKVL